MRIARPAKGEPMEAYEAIRTRRSIREYTSQAVPDDLVQELLAAGMSAPSSGDERPWHYVVVNMRERLDALAAVLPYGQMLKRAPLAIVVCGDLWLEQFEGNWIQDCSAATQNLLLAAHAKGLGAVWVGVYPETDRIVGMRKLLHLPAHVIPLSVVPVGYPLRRKPPADRYDESRVHYNTW